jgi:oligogalacturonide lyase
MSTPIQQGPRAGRHWPAESETETDPTTGATVRRLTGYPGSDNRHLYFTEDGWYDGGRRLLVRSVRSGTRDLYSVDLETGLITQLTDLEADVSDATCHPESETAYFWCGSRVVGLSLDSLEVWTVFDVGETHGDYAGSVPGVTADGETVCFPLVERAVPRPQFSGNRPTEDEQAADRGAWMDRMFEADPHSRVLAVPASGGEAETLVEEETWIGHVNTSPSRPALLTYCEEGPWHRVENRIWALNRETGETWRVRPTAEDEAVGHEYWLADGETVGYHGWSGGLADPEPFFGHARFDGTDRRETPAPARHTHFHSNTRSLVVGDGSPDGSACNLVWQLDESDGAYRGPRKLATHDWGGDDDAHPHSRLSPDGSHVAFDSTRAGDRSDVYLVDVPSFEDLPRHDPA